MKGFLSILLLGARSLSIKCVLSWRNFALRGQVIDLLESLGFHRMEVVKS